MSFTQKVIHIREHFRRSIQKDTTTEKLNTSRSLLKEILASYEQKKKFVKTTKKIRTVN